MTLRAAKKTTVTAAIKTPRATCDQKCGRTFNPLARMAKGSRKIVCNTWRIHATSPAEIVLERPFAMASIPGRINIAETIRNTP